MSERGPPQKSREERLREELFAANRTAASAGEIGRSTLSALEQQRETLHRNEDTLESIEYVLRRSKVELRGMSWSGWLYNVLLATEEPVPEFHKTVSATGGSSASSEGASGGGGGSSSSRTWHETVERESAASLATDESKQLDLLLSQVEELKTLSVVMGSQVGSQTEQLGRIDGKTDRVRDKTLEVTLKAAQYTSRSRRGKPKLLGRFQFVDTASGEFLAAVGEDLTLLRGADRATFFDVWQREDNLIGLQNCKTLKYVGSTFYGAVRCSGNRFGKQEECFVSNVEPRTLPDESGILVLAKNWGKGGWLKQSAAVAAAEERPRVLDSVTTSVSDKDGRLVFRSIFVKVNENPDAEEEN